MAEFYYTVGTQLLWRDATDYAPATANVLTVGTPTTLQLDLTGVGDDAAREGAKGDFGASGKIYEYWTAQAAVEWGTAPTTQEAIQLYMGWSNISGAGNGNPGNLTGSDAAYTGSPADLDEGLRQLTYLGTMIIATADANVQKTFPIRFTPLARYGIPVVVNRSGQALFTDAAEMSLVFTPYILTSA